MPKGQPVAVPADGLTTRQRRNRPLLMVHTGEMKGKSTAAFGFGNGESVPALQVNPPSRDSDRTRNPSANGPYPPPRRE